MKLIKEKVLSVIMSALNEDVGSGDVTTALIFEKDFNAQAEIITKDDTIIAGTDIVRWIFDAVDERIKVIALCKDGDRIKKGKKVIHLKGPIRGILSGERTALNFLSRLSGVATLTSEFVKRIKGTNVKILDTRKTMPGLRILEKYAVAAGGGYNHRMGLWDEVLIKDNHLEGLKLDVENSRLKAIIDSVTAGKKRGHQNIEIEVINLKEFKAALEAGADIIMLDNMKIGDIKKAVKLKTARDKRQAREVLLEASGGVNLDNVRSIAKTGVDRISIGALTHSAPSIDFSLRVCK
ncbi:MAG: carboxylating nicotinate-nucleotide diphosphorylase [Candidatus Omnitrophota bacterium]